MTGRTQWTLCPSCPDGRKDARARQCRSCAESTALAPEKVQFIRENVDRMTWAQLATAIGRKRATIRSTAARYGITRSASAATKFMREGKARGRTPTERFWAHVQKSDSCWIWTSATDGNGYGMLSINRRRTKAHRFSYELHKGPIGERIEICHRCDNPPCVNPDHLFAGTHRENMHDALAKGRMPVGEHHHQSRLTDEAVREIRRLHDAGATRVDIAARYGVSPTTIFAVIRGKTWRHVA